MFGKSVFTPGFESVGHGINDERLTGDSSTCTHRTGVVTKERAALTLFTDAQARALAATDFIFLKKLFTGN